MRVRIFCCMWMLLMAAIRPLGLAAQQTGAKSQTSTQTANPPGAAALSDEEKANQLSEQVGKLMVQCVNLLTAQDPLSLEDLQTATRPGGAISSAAAHGGQDAGAR